MATTKKAAGTSKNSNGGNGGNGSSSERSTKSTTSPLHTAQAYNASMVTKTNERDTDRVIPSPNTPTTRETSKSIARPDTNAIASRAYQIWKAEGCPEGRSEDHWLQAERELRGK